MLRKTVSGIMLAMLLLICMLTLAFKVQPVKTGGTIYIRADGSIDPPTAPIQRNGDFEMQSNVDWWPMFRHDLEHTGYSTSKAPNTNELLWNYTMGGRVLSSPTVADGKVYVDSNDDYIVYCLNASTGAHIWNYTTGSYLVSSPAVANGRVYVGSADMFEVNSKIYCLNASTGAHIWNYTTGSMVCSSPAVVDGKVYVGSHSPDCRIYCLDAFTGTCIWNYTTGGSVDSSPAVVDGKVYFGSCDYCVYCLNASTGAHIWNYTTGDVVYFSSPAVADGKVYVGSSDHNIYCFGSPVHDLAVIDVIHSKTGCLPMPTVGQNYNISIYVTVENKGDFEETFNLTAYANTTAIDTREVTLTSGSSTTITFAWNTIGFAKGNYTIKAYAWPVQNETDTEDNTLPDGWVIVTIAGDVNGDHLVDISDLVITVGTIPSSPTINPENWNPNADINSDGVCDISDLIICVGNIPSGPW